MIFLPKEFLPIFFFYLLHDDDEQQWPTNIDKHEPISQQSLNSNKLFSLFFYLSLRSFIALFAHRLATNRPHMRRRTIQLMKDTLCIIDLIKMMDGNRIFHFKNSFQHFFVADQVSEQITKWLKHANVMDGQVLLALSCIRPHVGKCINSIRKKNIYIIGRKEKWERLSYIMFMIAQCCSSLPEQPCPEALAIHSLSNEQMTKTTVYSIINLFTMRILNAE